jgi:hypothetical protein
MVKVQRESTLAMESRSRIFNRRNSNINETVDTSVGTIEDKPGKSLQDSLSPLLNGMRLCGLYFKWPFNHPSPSTTLTRNDNAAGNTEITTARKPLEVVCATYSIVVLIILWVNTIRELTVFAPKESGVLLLIQKLLSVSRFLQPAIQHTAFFMASRSGNLDRILNDVPQLPEKQRQRLHRNAVILTFCSWLAIANSICFQFYWMQSTFNDTQLAPTFIAPFGTLVPVTDSRLHQVVFSVATIHVHSSWILPLAMTLMLATTFSSHFRGADLRLREHIKSSHTITDDLIDHSREHHQQLCRLVERSDDFLRIHHSASFILPIYNIIGLLFVLVFGQLNFSSYLRLMLQTLYYLGIHIFQLSLTALSGVLVNHHVCTINAH